MVRKMMKVGDEVQVFGIDASYMFTGVITSVNHVAAKDVWYRVRPYGEGVAQGRSFWHRESHVKKIRK
tara:strand:+ start:226 stop:429 length:204 start_codon:yes stop_codon:yes gene_type:complete